MGFGETVTRESLIESAEVALRNQGVLIRELGQRLYDEGERGRLAFATGVREYGNWRGRRIRRAAERGAAPINAESLIRCWDAADVHLLPVTQTGAIQVSADRAVVTVESSPEWQEWRGRGVEQITRSFYSELFAGIAEGYGEVNVDPGTGPDLTNPWTITWSTSGVATGALETVSTSAFDDIEAGVPALRNTSQNYASLYTCIGRQTIKHFDMPGEELLREAIRALATERGVRIRERHLQEGKPLSMKSLMEDYDVPVVSVWEWKDEGYLTDGTWHQDCTYCPLYEVWRELNAVDLGYLYDYEFHMTQFRAYHPGIKVQFESIKTRGDDMCRFRFSLPELQQPGEPGFAGRSDLQ